jgi:hypothetical protein
VEKLGDEATADVSTAEVNALLACHFGVTLGFVLDWRVCVGGGVSQRRVY